MAAICHRNALGAAKKPKIYKCETDFPIQCGKSDTISASEQVHPVFYWLISPLLLYSTVATAHFECLQNASELNKSILTVATNTPILDGMTIGQALLLGFLEFGTQMHLDGTNFAFEL